MTKFIMENTKLPTFDPLPKYIWNMDLSDTDKLVYVALLGRTTLSQKNKWIDKEGHIFIVFEFEAGRVLTNHRTRTYFHLFFLQIFHLTIIIYAMVD